MGLSAFQLYQAYNANKDRIEETRQLIAPLVKDWMRSGEQITANTKALAEAFHLGDVAGKLIPNPAVYDVAWIQESLKAQGIPVEATGDYDKQTQDAVKEFQKLCKLDADGWVGPATLEALEQVKGVPQAK